MSDATTPSTLFTVTLRNERYEIDITKLTGHDRRDAKRLLEVQTFSIADLLSDEIGVYVLAFLAARKTNPTLRFEQVLDLTGDELQVELVETADGDDPFGDSPPKASKAKRSSSASSTAD
jgi:hypothetical protein